MIVQLEISIITKKTFYSTQTSVAMIMHSLMLARNVIKNLFEIEFVSIRWFLITYLGAALDGAV